jgi:hypothetical protein
VRAASLAPLQDRRGADQRDCSRENARHAHFTPPVCGSRAC